MANEVKTTFTADTKPLDQAVERARQLSESNALIRRNDAKLLADTQIKEANRAADGIIAANRRANQQLQLGSGSNALQNSRSGMLAPNILKAREEQARLIRSQDALATTQGRDPATQRQARANLANQGVDIGRQLASGQGITEVLLSQGPQLIENMALSGGKFASALSAAGKAAVTLAPVLAAGAVAIGLTYKITGDIRAEAERRLKVEEQITAEWNKQAIKIKAVNDERDKFNAGRDFAAAERSADRETFTSSEQIRIAQKRLQDEIDIERRYGGGSDEAKQRIAANEARIRGYDVDIENRNRTGFQAGETKDYWAEEAKKAEEAQKKWNESVEAGKKKAKELGDQWRNTFEALTLNAAGDNSITKIFLESDKAVRELRKNVSGLSPELQKVAMQMQEVATANKLFSARVDNAFAASDFRQKAQDLRDYKDPIPTEDQFMKALETFGQKFVKPVYDTVRVGTANSVMLRQRNPFLAEDRTTFGAGTGALQGTFGTVRRDTRDNIFAAYHQNGFRSAADQHEDLNSPLGQRRFIGGGTIRQERGWGDLSDQEKGKFYDMFKQADPASMKAQDRLDTSLRIASDFKAANPEQQAELDRKILAIGSQIDPKELRSDQREGLALANERMAVREETRWKEAQDARIETNRLLKKIAGEEKSLNDAAEKGGLQQVEVIVKDRTGSDTDVQTTRATQADVEARYRAGVAANLGYGGSNQGR